MRTERPVLWGVAAAAACLASCQSEPAAPIQLVVGADPGDRVSFRPRSALAEYVELPGAGNELRITLAEHEASCERFVSPGPGQAAVTVVIVTPPGNAPAPGPYPWAGHEAHGGSPAAPERAYALPTARIGPRSHVFQPGGGVQLEQVALEPDGKVRGLLAFEFPGDAEHEATAIAGGFAASICKLNRATGR